MIAQRYDEKKKAVLDICNRYLSVRGNTDDGVNADFLKKRMEDLENDRYVLMVVGEAKAGKSTFINALLGEPILPTDVLQSSSAIVEIFKSQEKYVEVRYADGHARRVQDDPNTPDLDEAIQYLRQIGAIQDRYRGIPTTLLDARIVEGSIKPDQPLPIAELEDESKLLLRGKETLIQEYVEDRTLAKIPKEITFGFPLKYAFDGLRLVDSPGVFARGGVEDATYAHIQTANAVLFVHSLESPVENSAFYDFVTQIVPRHTRETLFLVLTKSGGQPELEVEEKVSQAKLLYEKEFDPHRVLHVDSLLKIISDEIKDVTSVDSLEKHYSEQKERFGEKYRQEKDPEWRDRATTSDKKSKLLNNILHEITNNSDHEAVRTELRKSSNFDEMERIIDEFSNRAPDLQLLGILKSVKIGYEGQDRDLGENLSAWKEKRKDPQTFESEVGKIQNLLNDYRLSMNTHAEKVTTKFTGRRASHRRSLRQTATKHQDQISHASDRGTVRKALADFHDEMTSFADKIGVQIKSEFENESRRFGAEFKTKHKITVPRIDVSGIAAKTRDKAYRTVRIKRGPKGGKEWVLKIVTLGRKKFYEEKSQYDSGLHLSSIKTVAWGAVDERKDEFDELVRSLIKNIRPDFTSSLKTRIAARNEELEKIKMAKDTNEEILANIAEAERKKKDIAVELTLVANMWGDLS